MNHDVPLLNGPIDGRLIASKTWDKEELHMKVTLEKSKQEVRGPSKQHIDGDDQLTRLKSMIDYATQLHESPATALARVMDP